MKTFIKTLTIKCLFITIVVLAVQSNVSAQAREYNSRPSAQKTEKGFNKFNLENIVVGGNLGAQFGTITIVNLMPTVGFRLRDSWLIGVGATYQYYEDKRFNPSLVSNTYGGSIFTQYYFLENFTAHAEYERLNLDSFITNERVNTDAILLGGGYRNAIGSSSYVNMMLLYNIIEDENYPFRNPIVRVGFGIGL